MGSSINELGLIDRLFSIVNDEEAGSDPDVILANYFLTHYTELADLNVWDIADACYVSRSSVRRFCQRVGFDNYRQLKSEMRTYNHSYAYFMKAATQENYRDNITKELISMALELNRRCDTEEMNRIVTRIHDSGKVLFLTSYSTLSVVHEFQRPLVLSGKVVGIKSDILENDAYLGSMTENDYVFVVSAMGNYARVVAPMLKNCKARKAVLTASRKDDFAQPFDDVYHLSAEDYDGVKSWFGKYGMFYFFDVLYSEYVRKYGIRFHRNEIKEKREIKQKTEQPAQNTGMTFIKKE